MKSFIYFRSRLAMLTKVWTQNSDTGVCHRLYLARMPAVSSQSTTQQDKSAFASHWKNNFFHVWLELPRMESLCHNPCWQIFLCPEKDSICFYLFSKQVEACWQELKGTVNKKNNVEMFADLGLAVIEGSTPRVLEREIPINFTIQYFVISLD